MLQLTIRDQSSSLDWLEFVSAMTGSLAWPLAVVIVAAIFRSQISAFLKKIRAISYGDARVELAEKLDAIEDASREAANQAPELTSDLPIPDERFRSLVEIAPSAAIIDAWAKIEVQLRSIAKRRSYDQQISGSPYRTMKKLKEDRLITPSVYEMLRDLRSTRNVVAHNQHASTVDAIRFWNLSQLAKEPLENL